MGWFVTDIMMKFFQIRNLLRLQWNVSDENGKYLFCVEMDTKSDIGNGDKTKKKLKWTILKNQESLIKHSKTLNKCLLSSQY